MKIDSQEVQFRPAFESDLAAISELIRESTLAVEENQYTKEQCNTWITENSVEKLKARLSSCQLFCLDHSSELLGVVGLRENELINLYIAPFLIGRGVGTALLNHIENYARSIGISDLRLTSTQSGLRFYQRNGFVSHGLVEVEINGVIFRETKMTKVLGDQF